MIQLLLKAAGSFSINIRSDPWQFVRNWSPPGRCQTMHIDTKDGRLQRATIADLSTPQSRRLRHRRSRRGHAGIAGCVDVYFFAVRDNG